MSERFGAGAPAPDAATPVHDTRDEVFFWTERGPDDTAPLPPVDPKADREDKPR